MITHPIPPIYNKNSRVLILGSFPSVRSREIGFFYGHPQNRFWPLIAALCQERLPTSIEEKTELLLRHGIALWDVAAACEIRGSADSTLTKVIANDLSPIFEGASISQVFVNGSTAAKYYRRLIQPQIQRSAIVLPSTSPANATWSFERLLDAWRVIQPYLT
ncbi:MAG: DNA-deoxyinosine glycosylase [Clostridia bacterium]|nr:DNA-deoxyinosine glycosylase [Clostridia bacterium]